MTSSPSATTPILFEDACWPQSLVDQINTELDSGKTALQIWWACSELVHNAGEFWETCPRECLLITMDARGIRGFDHLACRFGYIPKGLAALECNCDPEEH